MDISTYTDTRREEWDAFVDAHPMAGYGHYGAHFTRAQAVSATNHSLMLVDEGRLQAVLPLFAATSTDLRVVPSVTLRSGLDFPAGPLLAATAPKLRARHLAALVEATQEVARRIRCDRIRIGYPVVCGERLAIDEYGYLPLRDYGYTETNVVSLVIDFARHPDPERLATYACRQSVRRAAEQGAAVSIIPDLDAWRACYPLNVDTLGSLAHSRQELDAVWQELLCCNRATAFACEIGGVTRSVIVSIHARTASYYWLGFNQRPQARGTAHMALAAAIRHARERGARFFELGSKEFVNPRQMGISRFKESFGGTPCYALDGVLERRPVKAWLLQAGRLGAVALRARRRPAGGRDEAAEEALPGAERAPAESR